jgi:biofilm protein TabA
MAIFGKLEDLSVQLQSNNRLKKALLILQDYSAGRLPGVTKAAANQRIGDTTRISLEGDDLYVLIQCYMPSNRETARFEAHQHFTDLQCVCEGSEYITVCSLRDEKAVPPFDTSGNTYFPVGSEPCNHIILRRGDIAVLFPNDAHAACLAVDGRNNELVRKIVVKVRDALSAE